jgi:hypothetical protein
MRKVKMATKQVLEIKRTRDNTKLRKNQISFPSGVTNSVMENPPCRE